MKHYLLFFLLLGFLNTYGQWAIPTQMRAENTLDRLSGSNGLKNMDVLYGVPLPPGNVIGDHYVDKKWNKSTLLLYKSEKLLEGYFIKYDLKNDVVEIRTSSGIKVMPSKEVKSIVWIDSLTMTPHYFVNGSEFKNTSVPIRGLLEVLVDGTIPLLKQFYLAIKDPTYITAFDVGSRDTKIYQKSYLFSVKDNQLIKLKSKDDIFSVAIDKAKEVERFAKTKKLSLKKENDLKVVFEWLNAKE